MFEPVCMAETAGQLCLELLSLFVVPVLCIS